MYIALLDQMLIEIDTDISEALNILELPQKKEFINNGKVMLQNGDVEFKGTTVKEKKFLGIF